MYGIRGNTLKWFESYLSDRSQYVTYDGMQSQILPIKYGVPQGSILGSLLFIIYMNDICNVSDLLYTILYADDTSVLLNDTNINELMDIINNELQKLYIWLRANKLTLNIDKTYYMIFHRARIKNKDFALGISINNCALKEVENCKYLGIILDTRISWVEHITYVKNKISKGICIMYQARKYLNRNGLISLYNSYIYPYLIYGVESWGNASIYLPHGSTICLTKKIVRIMIYSNYDTHSRNIFIELNILPLYHLIQNRISFMMYKHVNGLLPEVMNKLYVTNNQIHNHFTRQHHLFHTSKGHTNVYAKSFSNISPRIWNALQTKINV